MTNRDKAALMMRVAQQARDRGIVRGDLRLEELFDLAQSFVDDGMRPAEAVSRAAVLVFKEYGQPRRRGL